MKRINKFLFITVILSFFICLSPLLWAEHTVIKTPSKAEVVKKGRELLIPFIVNDGQIDEEVKFYASTFGGYVYITKNGEIVYSFSEYKANTKLVIKEKILNGRIEEVKGEKESAINVSCFTGNDPKKWKSNILTYETVNMGEVYKGIEVRLKAYGDNVEKLFCVKPGARPEYIRVKIEGAKALKMDEKGLLVAETDLGDIKFTRPVAYQNIKGKKVARAANYRLMRTDPLTPNAELIYGFDVAEYDRAEELVIDPLLSSTYLGGSGDDYGTSMAIDTEGNVYVAGWTKSSNFPKTTGVFDKSYSGGDGDAFVSKLNGDLTSLLASTFLGGTFTDGCNALAIGSDGTICVTGVTYSKDFPTTTDAYSNAYVNKGDAFVAKLSSDLTNLLAATYVGDAEYDGGSSIAVNTEGDIYVTGWTYSNDFPTTQDAYDTFYADNDEADIFVSKMSGDLKKLLASTFLGGGSADFSKSVVMSAEGNIYIGGWTSSSVFFAPSDAYDTSYNGGDSDAFISEMDGDLTTLLAFTYLGGTSADYGNKATMDSEGNICIAGWTASSNFPATTDAYKTSFGGGEGDAFVAKLDGGLKNLLASTYLGGSADDNCYSVAVDSQGNIYAAGLTVSSDFPTTTDVYSNTYGGGEGDIFISKLDGDLKNLLASTYLGGSSQDYANSVAVSAEGSVYVTGLTGSSDFPTTRSVYNTTNSGSNDVFVSKLDSDLSVTTEIEGTSILGYVVNNKNKPVKSAKITLKGTKNPAKQNTTTDEEGYFEFTDLEADIYMIYAQKKGYKKSTRKVNLEEGTEEEVDFTLKKSGQ